jgi:hypothetical protein
MPSAKGLGLAMGNAFLAFRGLGLVTMLAALGGCAVNQYATPRTVPKGKVAHTLALEGTSIPGIEKPFVSVRYQIRAGLAERVDLGVTLGPVVGVDLKVNFLRSKRVDMAIDPGIQYSAFPDFQYGEPSGLEMQHFGRGSAPLSLGINLTRAMSLSLRGGPSVTMVRREFAALCTERGCEAPKWHFQAEGGLGVQFRISDYFALQPEISVLAGRELAVQLGMGFSFGAQPSYQEFD